MGKISLFGMTLTQLQQVAEQIGMPRFAAKQIAGWLYNKRVEDIDQMTNISLAMREKLKENYMVGRSQPIDTAVSVDGTKKYIFQTSPNNYIESVMIPDEPRATLCVSSQVGCRMGCHFCMTSRLGLNSSLTSNQIVNQVASIPEADKLTNIVYMGMGEPMDNIDAVLDSLAIMTSDWGYAWSPTRITVSTVGVIPAMKRFLDESKAHLAVSLHNAISAERLKMMPVENKYPIAQVIELLKKYDFSHQRRVSFEYIVFKGLNDSPAHLKALVRMLGPLSCRVNLIRFHTIPNSEFIGADQQTMVNFRDTLTRHGIITTIRASRGEDIQAACGLLAGEKKEQ